MLILLTLLFIIIAGIPQYLSPFPWYYRSRCPHPSGITATIVPIPVVNTAVTTVLPQSPSPCQTLVNNILAQSYVHNTSQTPGAAGKQTSIHHWLSHTCLFQSRSKQWEPVTKTGWTSWGELGRHITQSTDDHRERAFLFQWLCVLIQCYNVVI